MGSHKKKLGLLSVWPEIMDSSPVIKTVIELKSVSVFSSIFQLQFVQIPIAVTTANNGGKEGQS